VGVSLPQIQAEALMPVVGYHMIGFDKGPLSFSETDLSLICSNRNIEKVYDFFEHCPHRFNLVFHNGDWRSEEPNNKNYHQALTAHSHWLLTGRIGRAFRPKPQNNQEIIKRLLSGVPRDDNAINFIYTSNATGTSFPIPMTPWMMAHRMAHVQMLATDDPSILTYSLDWGYHILKYAYGYELSRKPDVMDWNERLRPQPQKGGVKPHADARVFHGLFINMSTSRACRTGQLIPWFDYFPEWFAQYVKFGAIRLTPTLPEKLDLQKLCDDINRSETPFPNRELVTSKTISTDRFANVMGEKYEGVLRKWIGEVIVT
jgi:hypothetical protein